MKQRGFSLIELMVVVAIIGILATAAYVLPKRGLRNARVKSSVNQLVMQAGQLRTLALRDGQDYALVVVDAPAGDARSCDVSNPASCAQYFILNAVPTAWDPTAFPSPATSAAVMAYVAGVCPGGVPTPGPCLAGNGASYVMPKGVAISNFSAGCGPPAPFTGVFPAPPGGNTYAVRFRGDGRVSRILGGASVASPGDLYGLAIIWGSEEASGAADLSASTETAGMIISYPSGMIRFFRSC